MGTLQLTKLVLKNIADPKKAIALLPENENQTVLGTIMGIANGVKRGKAADGLTETTGLKGSFEGIPADATKDTIASGVCYLPEAFQQPIVDALESDNGPDSVQFLAEVILIRATNPQGYSWGLRPIGQVKAADPLEALRAQLAENKPALQIAGGEKAAAKK